MKERTHETSMKTFHCDHCGHLLFFENTTCVQCGRQVAFLPDVEQMGSLDPAGEGTWRSPLPATAGRTYRLCRNYTDQQVCNWAVPAPDSRPLCVSCRLTHVIPDLSQGRHRQAWYRLEVAKRRVIFRMMRLRLPFFNREDDPQRGLVFEFKTGAPDGTETVLTGHANGVITINVAEADDVERERQRKAFHEPHRSLLGHMRHEIGHYYWDRLIAQSAEITEFRKLFGDERLDYRAALKTHYEQGPFSDWPDHFISAYASAHPWEDWAETWAYYLHIVDALETAAACGMSLHPQRADEPSMSAVPPTVSLGQLPFRSLIDRWFPLSYALNNLNRGLGLPDASPCVLSSPAIAKLEYLHEAISRSDGSNEDSREARTRLRAA
jgi:hypothetical protein